MESSEPSSVSTLPSAPSTAGGIKETIESILVAFIFAFVFRAFVVEAFVIPTGSMATTLLGAHTRFVCKDCGYSFDLNYTTPQQVGQTKEEDVPPPPYSAPITTPIYCPNCGCQVKIPEQTNHVPVYYGDRILVLKYLYALEMPHPWDVVVFKAPNDMEVNYIKRLIANPGEAVMILDGDVYIRAKGDPDPKHFVIRPKPLSVQDAMWRLVNDNDFHPDLKSPMVRNGSQIWQQPWAPVSGTGWTLNNPADNGRTFFFENKTGTGLLQYGIAANPTAQTASDYLVYDQATPMTQPRPTSSRFPFAASDGRSASIEYPCSDLCLRASYLRTAGDGAFVMRLSKRDHDFTAEFKPDGASLYMTYKGIRSQIGGVAPMPGGSAPVQLELSNVDYRVTLRINGTVVAQTTPAQFAPDLKALLDEYDQHRTPPQGRIEMGADRQQCQVSHVSIYRDVFYYNNNYYNNIGDVRWATPEAFPSHAQVLGEDEFFVMGDNSLLSFDARCWHYPVDLPRQSLRTDAGKVPGRFMLGKAFFVYWPAGYQPGSMFSWAPAFTPNFGSMRFIH